MKNKKIWIIIVAVLALLIGGFFVFKMLTNKDEEHEPGVINTINDYELKENNTEYFKTLFQQLKETLSETDINEDAYARLVAQLFLADFFDLNSKTSSSDIGGLQFVYEPFRNDFIKLAKNSVYESVLNNIDGKRVQELPTVHSVTVGEVLKESFTYQDNTDSEAYHIKLVIGYEKNLGYQEDVSLIIIHNDKKLEVAKMGN